jgi:translation elongation factor P/translation initiation factor 5A
MKTETLKLTGAALLGASLLAITSCSSTSEGQGASMVATQTGVPGGVRVDTYTTTATVTGIEVSTRQVTLVSPAGKQETIKCGPEVINFDQIHIGDQVRVTAAERLVVYMAKDNPPASDGAAALVALAPKGAKPGGLVAQTVQVTAKVTAIDLKHRKATLQFPDGTTKTFAVRKDVDLTQRAVGEEVVIRATEALAIAVQKP